LLIDDSYLFYICKFGSTHRTSPHPHGLRLKRST